MSQIFQELLSSNPYAIIELYELHLVTAIHGSDDIYRFHNGVNGTTSYGEVKWQGQIYYPFPIETEGFEYSGNGQLPRPKVRISNITGAMSTILVNANAATNGSDLIGAKFIRIRTLSRFLDAENFPSNTNPYGTPDPDAEMPQEIYYVDRKTLESRDVVEFELAASFDMAGVRAPKRLAMSNLCQWEYRGLECGYTSDAVFDENDSAVSTEPAPNFTAGTTTLNVGQSLFVDQSLTSSNRWYKTTLQADGNFVTYAKDNTARWALNTVGSPSYRLFNQADGNLVIYNSGGIAASNAIWSTQTAYLGTPTALTHRDWRQESTINTGRAGAFFWEVLGSADSYPNQSRTATRAFTVGSRTITISYTATSYELSQQYKDAFTALGRTVNYAWTQGTPVIDNDYNDPNLKPMAKGTITASTGLWRVDEYFNAEVTVTSNNPWRNGDPVVNPGTFGTFTSVAAVYSVRTGSGYANNYLTMQDDGNLVYRNAAGTALWASNYVNTTEPRVATGTVDPADDVCGKRLTSCKARFGNTAELPFGGFPGLGGYY